MKERIKYDPEDLESLLAHKSFGELYDEEREFVLKHIKDETEYAELKQTLLLVSSHDNNINNLTPPPRIKDELMGKFAVEKKGGFWIWLNTTLSSLLPTQLFAKPAVGWSLAGIACVVAVWFLLPNLESKETRANLDQVQHKEEIRKDKNFEENGGDKIIESTEKSENLLEKKESVTESAPIEVYDNNSFAWTDDQVNQNMDIAPSTPNTFTIESGSSISDLSINSEISEKNYTLLDGAVDGDSEMEEDVTMDIDLDFALEEDEYESMEKSGDYRDDKANSTAEAKNADFRAANESRLEATSAITLNEVSAESAGKKGKFKKITVSTKLNDRDELLDELFTAL